MMKYLIAAGLTAALIAVTAAVYIVIQHRARPRRTYNAAVEGQIPFMPQFVWPYLSWFALLLLAPMTVYLGSCEDFVRYCIAFVFVGVICMAAYIVFPVAAQRPMPELYTSSGRMLIRVFAAEGRGLNRLPSLNCATASLFIMAALFAQNMPDPTRVGLVALSITTVVSSLFIRQHSIVDVAAALPVGAAAWVLAGFIDPAPIAQALGLM